MEFSQKATHAERIALRDLEQRLEMVEKRLHIVFNAKAELEEGSRPRSLTCEMQKPKHLCQACRSRVSRLHRPFGQQHTIL